MNPALTKTIGLFLMILIGWGLQRKLQSRDQLSGLKTIILSVALPATIFLALLKVPFQPELLSLPLLGLLLNLILWGMVWLIFPLHTGHKSNTPTMRTLLMLLPSLAPGLSCFPFVGEYLGEEALALAAMTDVGNKVFVLILLYMLAMHWHYQESPKAKSSSLKKLGGLAKTLISEPVNMVLVVALSMIFMGWDLRNLPGFLQDTIGRLGLLMTPLVLLFIGMAVKVKPQQFLTYLGWLLIRSGLGFFISGIVLLITGWSGILVLVVLLFTQSAISFWPFAHMSSINEMEKQAGQVNRTFSLDTAINLLAISLPLSTVIMLSICSIPLPEKLPYPAFGASIISFVMGFGLPLIMRSISTNKSLKGIKA
ncbi:MAG: permease [Saprospiraceae bacterium]|nr:permease [Saprospiraceae bacterium]